MASYWTRRSAAAANASYTVNLFLQTENRPTLVQLQPIQTDDGDDSMSLYMPSMSPAAVAALCYACEACPTFSRSIDAPIEFTKNDQRTAAQLARFYPVGHRLSLGRITGTVSELNSFFDRLVLESRAEWSAPAPAPQTPQMLPQTPQTRPQTPEVAPPSSPFSDLAPAWSPPSPPASVLSSLAGSAIDFDSSASNWSPNPNRAGLTQSRSPASAVSASSIRSVPRSQYAGSGYGPGQTPGFGPGFGPVDETAEVSRPSAGKAAAEPVPTLGSPFPFGLDVPTGSRFGSANSSVCGSTVGTNNRHRHRRGLSSGGGPSTLTSGSIIPGIVVGDGADFELVDRQNTTGISRSASSPSICSATSSVARVRESRQRQLAWARGGFVDALVRQLAGDSRFVRADDWTSRVMPGLAAVGVVVDVAEVKAKAEPARPTTPVTPITPPKPVTPTKQTPLPPLPWFLSPEQPSAVPQPRRHYGRASPAGSSSSLYSLMTGEDEPAW